MMKKTLMTSVANLHNHVVLMPMAWASLALALNPNPKNKHMACTSEYEVDNQLSLFGSFIT